MTTSEDVLLVVGGSGFLGAHVLARAAGRFARLISASRRPAECPASVAGRGHEQESFDASSPREVAALLANCEPTHVLLLAALSRVGPCEADPALARRLNAEFPEEVARICAARGSRLVHVSTDLVFGGGAPRGERYTEDDPPAPVHTYGRSKSEGEERVLAANPAALVVRVPLLYGDSGGRALGASDDLLAILARGETPNLFHDEWRTPLHAAQAAQALLEAVAKPLRGLLHVAGPERVNRHQLGLLVLEATGLAPEEARRRVRACLRSDLGVAEARPADLSLDTSRARSVLDTALLSPRESLTAR